MKIKTTKSIRLGKKVKIGGVIVAFDKNLECELSTEEAEIVKAADPLNILLEGEEPVLLEASEEDSLKLKKGATNSMPSPAQAAKMLDERKAKKESLKKSGDSPILEDSNPKKPNSTEEKQDSDAPEEKEASDDLGIEELSIKEICGICESEGYPKEEWKNLKKDALVSYVKSKL